MHQQGSVQPTDLAQIFFRVAAMVSNDSVDLMTGGCDKSHQRTEAVSLQADFSGRLRQLSGGADRFPDIFRAGVAIICCVKSEAVLPVIFRSYAEIDAGLLPPEQVRRDRDEPLGCQLVAGRADIGINAKQFLQNDHRRRGYLGWLRM